MAPAALLEHHLAVPTEETAAQAAEAVEELERFLRRHPDVSAASVSLTAMHDDTTLEIPSHALRLLVDMLAQIANGNAVTVAPVHAELTTQQAAEVLNVSRPYVVKLLNDEKIPYRRVGNRRRVMLVDVLEYQHRDSAHRRKIADQLTAEAQRLGLYD